MSQQHYSVKEEFEVTLVVKVKLKSISNYFHMSDFQIEDNIEDVKSNMKKHLLNKICGEFDGVEDLSYGVDYWDFEVESI